MNSACLTPHAAWSCACPTPHAALRISEKGQALLELAIFGSLLIFVLGALVNYGLTADLTQQAQMRAFRQALADAVIAGDPDQDGTPTSVSRVLIEEHHNPSPSHPLGIGAMVPVAAEATSPTWSHRLPVVPENPEEVPRSLITLQGEELRCGQLERGCAASGFREVRDVPPEELGRYEEVYGKLSVSASPGTCLEHGQEEINPQTGEIVPAPCVRQTQHLRILDGCEGEISSYELCYQRAVQLMDAEVCARECERGRSAGSATDCHSVCSVSISSPPWYAEGGAEGPDGAWAFPALERMHAEIRSLGLLPAYARRTSLDTALVKRESARGLASDGRVGAWHVETNRLLVYKPHDNTHEQNVSGRRREQPIGSVSKDAQPSVETWTTPHE